MPRVRPLEVKALLPLLQQDWDSPEALAEALIVELDQTRAERTSYVAVMQIGKPPNAFYMGVGPYPGRASALKALIAHPGRDLATACVIATIETPEGLKRRLKELDTQPSKAG